MAIIIMSADANRKEDGGSSDFDNLVKGVGLGGASFLAGGVGANASSRLLQNAELRSVKDQREKLKGSSEVIEEFNDARAALDRANLERMNAFEKRFDDARANFGNLSPEEFSDENFNAFKRRFEAGHNIPREGGPEFDAYVRAKDKLSHVKADKKKLASLLERQRNIHGIPGAVIGSLGTAALGIKLIGDDEKRKKEEFAKKLLEAEELAKSASYYY